MRIEHIGNATLYLGDSREILPTLERFNSLITDPPYGVELKNKKTKDSLRTASSTYEDTEEHFLTVILPTIPKILSQCDRGLIFCGTRQLQKYPEPADIGGIICPNGGGRTRWGFGCYHPALFYGKSPYLSKSLGGRPTCKVIYHPGLHVTGESDIDHPCPKPIAFMKWAVYVASLEGDSVFDPFMGSGTTGIACHQLGRTFTGIEIDPHYFDIACKRIEDAQRQNDLFLP
ncbi:MAG: DNA-methyltransferase [Geminicoccaceae bacterium]